MSELIFMLKQYFAFLFLFSVLMAAKFSAAGAEENSPRFQPWVGRTKIHKPRRGGRSFTSGFSVAPPGLGLFLSFTHG
jgi:hypothetical protein